jgi:hypothetical protein
MKATSTAVHRFIEHFGLMSPEGIVNFNANILSLKSEVFILSVNPKSVDAINLLNPEIAAANIPVMFQSGKEVFSYIDDKCLIIIGNNAENGDYVLSIFPEKSKQAMAAE